MVVLVEAVDVVSTEVAELRNLALGASNHLKNEAPNLKGLRETLTSKTEDVFFQAALYLKNIWKVSEFRYPQPIFELVRLEYLAQNCDGRAPPPPGEISSIVNKYFKKRNIQHMPSVLWHAVGSLDAPRRTNSS